MFQGSPKSTVTVPVASSFKTPKPVILRNRVNARESVESSASQESVSSANHNSAHSDRSTAQLCRTRDLPRKISLPLQESSSEQTPRPRNWESEVPAPQNSNSSSNQAAQRTITYPNPRQYLYSNGGAVSENLHMKREGSAVPGRDGFEPCMMPHGYVASCGQMAHCSLTDTDKLQQFNSLGRHSNDGITHWSSSGQPQVFEVDQNQHRVSGGYLVPERDNHPRDAYGVVEPSQHRHYAGSSYDLSAWLQQHKQNLRQQQQLSDVVYQNQVPSRYHYSSTGNLVDSVEKLEILKQAADDIIRAKDSIIERQKARIIQLETQAVKSKYCSTFGSDHESSNAQILEKKLGAVEYELQETKRSSGIVLLDKENMVASLKDQLKEKDSIINDWSSKFSAQKSDLERLQNEISSNKRYLSELPTAEQHSNNLSLIKSLEEENRLYKDETSQLEKKLKQLANDLQSKDSHLQRLEDSNKELNTVIHDLEAYNGDLTEKLSLRVDLLELNQLQKENKRLGADLEKARKLMDALNNQMKQLTLRHKAEIAGHAERLEQQKITITSFQEQSRDQDQMLKNCKQAVKELTAETQKLMDQKVRLEEELKDLRQPDRVEDQKLQQMLFKELSNSSDDMNRLIKVCLEKVNGQDPNLGLLLGIRDCSFGDESMTHSTAAVSLNSLKSQLSKARILRHEIDKLREIVADRFAEDMGRRLTCNPQ